MTRNDLGKLLVETTKEHFPGKSKQDIEFLINDIMHEIEDARMMRPFETKIDDKKSLGKQFIYYTPNGEFYTSKEAGEANGCGHNTVVERCNNKRNGEWTRRKLCNM